MITKISDVDTKQYIIVNESDNTALLTTELHHDVAFSFKINDLHIGGLGRMIDIAEVRKIFAPYISQGHKIIVNIVGGSDHADSIQYAKDLITCFNEMNASNIFDIHTAVNRELHYNEHYLALGEIPDDPGVKTAYNS